MSEEDYTKDSTKWPKTPGKDWQYKQLARGSRKAGGGTRKTKDSPWGNSKNPSVNT